MDQWTVSQVVGRVFPHHAAVTIPEGDVRFIVVGYVNTARAGTVQGRLRRLEGILHREGLRLTGVPEVHLPGTPGALRWTPATGISAAVMRFPDQDLPKRQRQVPPKGLGAGTRAVIQRGLGAEVRVVGPLMGHGRHEGRYVMNVRCSACRALIAQWVPVAEGNGIDHGAVRALSRSWYEHCARTWSHSPEAIAQHAASEALLRAIFGSPM